MTATAEAPANLPATTNGQKPAPTAMPVAIGGKGVVLNSLDEMWRFAKCVHLAGWAPKGMPIEGVVVAMQFGLELGMGFMSSLQNIAVINGHPGIYGDAAKALVMGTGMCDFIWETETDNKVHSLVEEFAVSVDEGNQEEISRLRREIARAKGGINRQSDEYGYTSVSKRNDSPMSIVSRFTLGDAKAAGLLDKAGPWKQYRSRMLMWRARGFNLRDNFPDVLKGLRTVEELQDFTPASGGASGISNKQDLFEKLQGGSVPLGEVIDVPTTETAAEKNGATGEGTTEKSQQDVGKEASQEATTAPVAPVSDTEALDIEMNEIVQDYGDAENMAAVESVDKRLKGARDREADPLGDMRAERCMLARKDRLGALVKTKGKK